MIVVVQSSKLFLLESLCAAGSYIGRLFNIELDSLLKLDRCGVLPDLV